MTKSLGEVGPASLRSCEEAIPNSAGADVAQATE